MSKHVKNRNKARDNIVGRESAGVIPWDTGRPSSELIRVVEQLSVAPCRTLELGCCTGANAVYLATCFFEVTAVDESVTAIEQAVARADAGKVRVNFRLADVFNLPSDLKAPFGFVFDSACYAYVSRQDAARYVATIEQVTEPGSQFLLLVPCDRPSAAAAASRKHESKPSKLNEKEIRAEFGSLFHVNWIRQIQFDGRKGKPGVKGWSCFMTRL